MEQAIRAILSNVGLILPIIGLVVAYVRVRRAAPAEAVSPADIYWQELLFYGVGIAWLWYGSLHMFAQELASREIGWQPSPFEFELGCGEVGVGIVALLSRVRSYDMRLAVTIIFAVFSFGAAAQHIYFIACCHNMNPGNAGVILWFNDIVLPLVLIALAWGSSRVPARRRSLP